jgi:hypothetical protein
VPWMAVCCTRAVISVAWLCLSSAPALDLPQNY